MLKLSVERNKYTGISMAELSRRINAQHLRDCDRILRLMGGSRGVSASGFYYLFYGDGRPKTICRKQVADVVRLLYPGWLLTRSVTFRRGGRQAQVCWLTRRGRRYASLYCDFGEDEVW